MRLYYFTFLMLCCSISTLFGQVSANEVTNLLVPSNELQSFEKQQLLERNYLTKANVLSLDAGVLQEVYTQNQGAITLHIPVNSEEFVVLELEQIEVTSPSLRIVNADNQLETYQTGVHYRGKVAGHTKSLAAISIFEGEMMGAFAYNGSTYNLERLHSLAKRTRNAQYIVYRHEDARNQAPFECGTSDEPTADLHLPNTTPYHPHTHEKSGASAPVSVYFECDNKMYRDFGSNVQTTVDFTTGLFNVVAGLFADAGVTMTISEIKVWTTPDPYGATSAATTSGEVLDKFRCEAEIYNGTLAHLLSTGDQGLGGVGELYGCPLPSTSYGFSNIDPTYNENLSVYSWSVNVLAHELGHQMSSPHTHACAWNGNNTAIDDCGSRWIISNNTDDDNDGTKDEDDEAEGFECWDQSNPNIPASSTIMSYCHLNPFSRVDLSLGFHPQVAEKMRDYADNCIRENIACSAPTQAEIVIDEVTEFGATITCTKVADFYNFQYRQRGAEDWINPIGFTPDNFITLTDLTPNTSYEYRITIACSNDQGNFDFGLTPTCKPYLFQTEGITACTGFDAMLTEDIVDPLCEASDGSAVVEIIRGNQPYNITWEGANNGSGTSTSRSFMMTGLTEGDYSVTITDVNDCFTMLSFSMNDDEDCAALRCANKGTISCGDVIDDSLDGQPNDYDADDLRACIPNATGLDGPDKAYEFTLTERTAINARLSGLTNDMDMYIVSNCVIGGRCLSTSLNIGTDDESINADLEAGTYFILVDRFEDLGGTDDFQLSLSCGDCNAEFSVVAIDPVDPNCDAADGSITVVITEGTTPFQVALEGASTGQLETSLRAFTLNSLLPGDYTVSITDANGCEVQANFTLADLCVCNDFAATISNIAPVDCQGVNGSFDLNIEAGTAPFNVNLQGTLFLEFDLPDRFITLSDLPEGQYQLYVTDANGCEVVQPLMITKEENCEGCEDFSISVDNITSPDCGATNGRVTVNITAGAPDFTISWSGAAAGSQVISGNAYTLENLPVGSYTIRVADNTGCVQEERIRIREDASCACTEFAISVDNIEQPLCDGTPGIFRLNIEGGVPIYRIIVTGDVDDEFTLNNEIFTFRNFGAGTYNITVIDNNSCTASTTVTLVEVVDEELCPCNDLTLMLDNPVNPTCEDNDGKFDVFIEGGTGDFTIEWTGAASGTQTQGGRFYSVKDLMAGDYTVMVTDAEGCTATADITLVAPSDCEEEDPCEGFSLDLRNPVNPTCEDNDGKFDVFIDGGMGDFTIEWTGAASGTQAQGGRFYSVKDLPAGNYTVMVTDANGCTAMASTTLVAPSDCEEEDVCEGFSIDLRNAVNPSCDDNDGKFDVFIDGGMGQFTIEWTGTASGTQMQGGRFYSARMLPAGDYTVMVTDANGCTATASITLISDCDPCEGFSVALSNVINPSCTRDDGKFNINITGGTGDFTIEWIGAIDGGQVQSGRFLALDMLIPGDYGINVTDANGCTFRIGINLPEPTNCDPCEGFDVDFRNPINPTCENNDGRFNIVIGGGTGDYTITWTGPVSGTQVQAGSFYSLQMLPAGDYTVMVTDAEGCTDMVSVTLVAPNDCEEENPCEGFSINLRNPVNPTCTDNDGKFDVFIDGGAGNFIIEWTGAATGTQMQGGRFYSVRMLTAGDYTVMVTDANGCTTTASITLIAPSDCEEEDPCEGFSIDLRNPVNPTCNDNDGKFDVFIDGGMGDFTIEWTGAATGTQMQGGRFYSVKTLTAGDYTVMVTDANGCTAMASITLTVPSDCDDDEEEDVCEGFSIDLRNPVNPTCNDNDGKFDVTIDGGMGEFTIEWTGAASGTQMQGGRFYSVKTLTAGDYTVMVTDANGCTAMASITLTAPSDCDDDEEEDVCEGFSIDLRNPVNSTCNDNDGKFDIFIDGGMGEFTIEWTGAATGTQMQGGRFYSVKTLTAGDYTVMVTDANGCTAMASITLTAPSDCDDDEEEDVCEGLSIDLRNPVNPTCNDNDGKFDVTIQQGTADFNIAWSGPVSGMQTISGRWFSVKNLPAGDYSVTVTDANDCNQMAMITLTAPTGCDDDDDEEEVCEGFSIDLRNAINPSCDDNDGKFDIFIEGGTSEFMIEWMGAASGTQMQGGRFYSTRNLPAGDYTVMVTDANGCTATASTRLVAPSDCEEEDVCEGFSIDLRNAINLSCDDDYGKFDIFIDGGTSAFMIEWMGAASGTQMQGGRFYSVKNLPVGNYTVIVTDANGCTATASTTLVAPSNCEEEDPCDGFSIDLRNAVNPSCDDNDGKFDIFIDGGTAEFMIEWMGAASGTQMQFGRFYSVKDLPAGDYTVMATDANGCTATASTTLVAPSDCDENDDSDCGDVISLTCNEPINGTTIGGTSSFTRTDYGCYNQAYNFEGNDVVHSINVPTNTAKLTIELTRMSKDLDIFVLDGCMPGATCVAESRHNSAFLDERIVMDAPAAGTYYIVVDGATAIENSTYRLVAKCQSANISDGTSVQLSNINTLTAFPNPTDGQLVTQASFSEVTTAQLELVNAMGQRIATYRVDETQFLQHQFDLSQQAAGVYFLKLQTATSTKIQQIVLMR